eukprot:148566_1
MSRIEVLNVDDKLTQFKTICEVLSTTTKATELSADFASWQERINKAQGWSSHGPEKRKKLVQCLAAADPVARVLFDDIDKHKMKEDKTEYVLHGSSLPAMQKLADALDVYHKPAGSGGGGIDLNPHSYVSGESIETEAAGATPKIVALSAIEKAKQEVLSKEYAELRDILSALAKSEYYNELNVFDDSLRLNQHYDSIHSSSSLPVYDRNHFQSLNSGEYHDVSGSSMLIGGVVGASAVVVIMLIFCVGLACGMLIYWGLSQKKALDEKRKRKEMRWIDNDDEV